MGEGIIKPLIICGGCSFTHAPDSWAHVLGNYRNCPNESDFAQQFFDVWKNFGIKECGADPTIFPETVYEYWEEGDDLTDIIDVMIVGQGAAGNELNSRVIRDVISNLPKDRPVGVFWQLSGWDRIEMMSNIHSNRSHKELYIKEEHMTSVIRPYNDINKVTHISGGSYENETHNAFKESQRYWWKSGGAVAEQWVDTPLEKFMKHYYEDAYCSEYTMIKNLEAIEYTRIFCDERNIPITIFPGWAYTWESALNLGHLLSNISGFELLNRLPDNIVSDIDGYDGIAEWGSQHRLYYTDKWYNHLYDNWREDYYQIGDEGGSEFEKYYHEGKFSSGNHPSCHIHALFCNDWIKPKVKQLLEKIN